MKISKLYNAIFLLCIIFAKSQISINIKNYGAKGDGKSNDYIAFKKSIDEALKHKNAEIIIPYGKYSISQSLELKYIENNIKIKGLKNSKGEFPVIKIDKFSDIISVKGQLLNQSKGSFEIENIVLKGYNEPYSENHPYINQKKWFAGIQVQDKNQVKIKSIIVKDIYGEGIIVSASQRTEIPLEARSKMVEISNCKVINVWGYNKDDDYGDGIYLSNASKAYIYNNFIKNNITETKQLGRVGVVIEYMAENVILEGNTVDEGYDRAFHLEASYGGHIIENNKFFGSDVAMVVSESYSNYKDTYIKENTLSNRNFKKNQSLKLLLAKDLLSYRCLIVINTTDLKGKVYVSNNKFIVDSNFKYNGWGVINSNSDVSDIFSNSIEVGKDYKNVQKFNGNKVYRDHNNSFIKNNK